ncbi:unnamed protein product [Ixodes pacificus]
MAAKSTTAGTPLQKGDPRSWSSTLAGLKATSTPSRCCCCQSSRRSTSFCSTWKPSQLRTADSSSTRIEKGSRPAAETARFA